MIDLALGEIAETFWLEAGGGALFPRDPEPAALTILPLAVCKLPRLWVREAESWLLRRSIPCNLGAVDRPLHGCLVARNGRGMLLLDGTDPPDEQRFTVAHEVAHFLLDYLRPREHAAERLGSAVIEVFDGRRAATADERIDALLSETAIGVHTHLMERRADGSLGCGGIGGAEVRADRLALELLAPEDEVRRCFNLIAVPDTRDVRVAALTALLLEQFGLPGAVAAPYARALVGEWHGGRSVRELFGLS
jgi:hypothetical protein